MAPLHHHFEELGWSDSDGDGVGDLAVGASATVTVVVRVDSDQVGDLSNVARVSASNPRCSMGM